MNLKLHDLTFAYKDTPVLSQLNDEFFSGTVHYLIGYNGAGVPCLI